jgi:hypothetical protein
MNKASSADRPNPSIAEDVGDASPDLKCSEWARENEVDPIGTAGIYEGYLLIEWPLPWPRDFAETDALQPILRLLDGSGVRLQGLVPKRKVGERRIICFRKPADPFVGFVRVEQRYNPADPASFVPTVEAVLDASITTDDATSRHVPSKEVLICSHGKRDRCCGSLGTTLALQFGKDIWHNDGAIDIWRTSHTGGHRFAPTAIVLPEGTVWGFLSSDILNRLVARSGPVDDLLHHYRGCAGLGSPRIQALERAVLGRVGWNLLDQPRQGFDFDGDRVRLAIYEVDGSTVTWEANVSGGRILPSWSCGTRPEQAAKVDQEWVVTNLSRV